MKALSLSLLVVLLLSCSHSTETESGLLLGTWHDLSSYDGVVVKDGQVDSVSYPNIMYSFFENGHYSIQNELPWAVPSDGEWQFSEKEKVITLVPDTNDEELGLNRTYKFEVISLSESELEVTFKYWGAPLEEGGEPIEIQFYRKFEK